MANGTVTGYSRAQVGLHWAVAALILFQYFAGEWMEEAHDVTHSGQALSGSEALLSNLHIIAGVLVLLFALARLVLRLTRGAPQLPEAEHPALRLAAHATHFLIYALIVLIPLSGLAAHYLGVGPAAEAHEIMFNVLVVIVGIHVAGALYQHFILKTDVLRRMVRPQRAA